VVRGYRLGEVVQADLPEIKQDAVIGLARAADLNKRPAVLVDLGCSVRNAAMPHPCPADPETMRAGVAKRFCSQTPIPDGDLLREFKTWTYNKIRELWPERPGPETDVSFESWLKKCNYPEYRKTELRDLNNLRNGHLEDRDYIVKSFMKDETYPEYKYARGINSRSDMFKIFVGPIFRIIEEIVFKLPEFIKKIPVRDRPAYIKEKLERIGCTYLSTDYTAFETLFTKEMMEACEMQLYEYLSSDLNGGPEWYKVVHDTLTGENFCRFKFFDVVCSATRMSGEMNTSLGNGFTNLMAMWFLSEKAGCTDFAMVAEGDDGLSTMTGQPPTSADFAKLGLNIKLQRHDKLEEASFCGLVFDPDDLINVTDPREVLCEFGWALSRYANCRRNRLMALLRCKSLSYQHQYPGSPIIQSLAQYGLRCTSGFDVRHFATTNRNYSMWEREQVLQAIDIPVLELHTWLNHLRRGF